MLQIVERELLSLNLLDQWRVSAYLSARLVRVAYLSVRLIRVFVQSWYPEIVISHKNIEPRQSTS